MFKKFFKSVVPIAGGFIATSFLEGFSAASFTAPFYFLRAKVRQKFNTDPANTQPDNIFKKVSIDFTANIITGLTFKLLTLFPLSDEMEDNHLIVSGCRGAMLGLMYRLLKNAENKYDEKAVSDDFYRSIGKAYIISQGVECVKTIAQESVKNQSCFTLAMGGAIGESVFQVTTKAPEKVESFVNEVKASCQRIASLGCY